MGSGFVDDVSCTIYAKEYSTFINTQHRDDNGLNIPDESSSE